MSTPETTSQKQVSTRFKPGVSGNPAGRPKGTRHKLNEAFIADMSVVWEERGIEALRTCAMEKPSEFCRIVALLMPRDLNLSVALDPTNFASKLQQASQLLGIELNPPRPPRKPLPGQPRHLIEHQK
jgi:hypothetical protein